MVQLNDSFFVKNDEKDVSNWDASEKDWANAGNHRLLDYTYLSKDIGLTGYEVTNPKDEDLDVIKAAVNDGHILSITTWISGFELKNIAAADLDKLCTLNINGVDYQYSVLDYVKGCLLSDKTSENMKALAAATYRYNQAANDYFGR